MAEAEATAATQPASQETGDRPITVQRWTRWTRKKKQAFLDHLAESCSVTLAARAIGVEPGVVHHLRRRDAAFAAEWVSALEAGYTMIETRLVGHVLAGRPRTEIVEPAGGGAEPIHVEDALRLLAARDAREARRLRGEMANVGGAQPRYATARETDEAILRKLRALRRRAASTGDDRATADEA